MFNKLENFNKFTELSKDFWELNDKLIIQHFYHIYIRTLTYTIYSSNFSIQKYIILIFFQSYKHLERPCITTKEK